MLESKTSTCQKSDQEDVSCRWQRVTTTNVDIEGRLDSLEVIPIAAEVKVNERLKNYSKNG